MKKIYVLLMLVCFMGGQLFAAEVKTEFRDVQPEFIRNNDGTFSGLCFELMKLIEKDSGIKFVYPESYIPTKRVQSDLKDGTSDVHFGFRITEERKKEYIYGELLYPVGYRVVVSKDDNVEINALEDIKKLGENNTVLSNFGTGTTDYLKKDIGLKIDDGGKDTESNLSKLASNRGRFFIDYDISLFYHMESFKGKSKLKVLPKVFNSYEHYVVFSKNLNKETIDKINKSIVKLKKTSEWQNIVDKYSKIK